MAVNLIPTSLPGASGFGGGTAYPGTAEEDLRKKIALALAEKSMSTEPIKSPWQGAAQMAWALVGGLERSKLREDEKKSREELTKAFMGLPGLSGGETPAMGIPAPVAPPAPPPPAPEASMPPINGLASAMPGIMPSPAAHTMRPPEMSNDVVRAARQAIEPVPMPRPRPDIPPTMASDGMPAPRPPGDIPTASLPIPPNYIEQIKKFEGFTPKAKWDYKQHSIGYGTRAAHPGEQIDRPTAEQRLIAELSKAANVVNKIAPNAPEGAKAALTSLTFNSGDKWTRSGLGQLVKAGDWQGAQQRLLAYNKAGGQVLPGLAQRRQAEAQWFAGQPQQAPQGIPLPRPRPTNIPQDVPPGMPQPPAGPPQNPEMMSSNPVRLASLNGMPSPDTPQAPQGVQMAQAQQAQPQPAPFRPQVNIPPQVANQIRQYMSSPNPKVQALGLQLYQQYAKPIEPTNDMKEYNYATKDPNFKNYQIEMKQAGRTLNQVQIDQRGENEFNKEAGKLQAKRFNDLAEDGPAARQMMSDVEMLRDLGTKIQTGKGAEVKATLGPYAQALGINVEGLNEIQAYEAIVNRVAPNLRVKGSGAQSDYELRSFLKSIPSIGNTPDGNEIVARTMEGMYQNKLKAAEIGAQALNGEITRTDAEKLLRDLPDPMKEWREFNKKKPAESGGPVRKYNPATGRIE